MYLCNVELGFFGVIVLIWVYILCFWGVEILVDFFFKELKFLFNVGDLDFYILLVWLFFINWLIVGIWLFFFCMFVWLYI